MSGQVFAAGESTNVFTPHDQAQIRSLSTKPVRFGQN